MATLELMGDGNANGGGEVEWMENIIFSQNSFSGVC